MKTVWHFYANQQNMGDWASALGVRQFLAENSSEEIRFVDHFLLDAVSDRTIERINAEADLVVVGGGGLWFQKEFPLGWLWNITLKQLHAIKPPIVLYSVGLNAEYLRQNRWTVGSRAREGIGRVLDRADLVGVRDYWTRNWVEDTFARQVDLLPCPSIFLDTHSSNARTYTGNCVGVNVVPSEKIWKYGAFVKTFSKVLTGFADQGFAIKYLCHSGSPEDTANSLNHIVPGELVVPVHPCELLEEYASTSLVFSMRAHSVLFAINRRKPVFSVAYNRKCLSFLELFDQQARSYSWGEKGRRGFAPLEQWRLKRKIASVGWDSDIFTEAISERIEACKRLNNEFSSKTTSLI